MKKLIISILILGVTAFSIVGCSSSDKKLSEVDIKDKNVVVILVDTLRADHLPQYGYKKDTAPFLADLAQKSIVFDKAFSACSYTAPAVASVFTSMYPSQHGVTTGHFANLRLQKGNQTVTFDRIPAELNTLAEEMKAAGYKTFAVADNLNISEEMGFTQGFDKSVTYRDQGSAKINETLKDWSSEIKSGGKYFLYVHYMDPHEPYKRQAPWYVDSENPHTQMINAYDSEIRVTDEHIKELFSMFELDKNSIVIFLSDHGEEFGEHGQIGHGKTLYTEVIHVPFMIYAPGITGSRVADHVSTIDILPTLSGLLGFPSRNEWEGKNLIPLVERNQKEDRFLFSELLRKPEHPRPEFRSVVTPDWHFLTIKPKDKELKRELYNIRTDFADKHNVAEARAEIAGHLEDRLKNVGKSGIRYTDTNVEKPLSPEGLEELKTLGYAE